MDYEFYKEWTEFKEDVERRLEAIEDKLNIDEDLDDYDKESENDETNLIGL